MVTITIKNVWIFSIPRCRIVSADNPIVKIRKSLKASHIHNGNGCTWKDGLYTETGTWFHWTHWWQRNHPRTICLLTQWRWVAYILVSELGHHLFRKWLGACSAPSFLSEGHPSGHWWEHYTGTLTCPTSPRHSNENRVPVDEIYRHPSLVGITWT